MKKFMNINCIICIREQCSTWNIAIVYVKYFPGNKFLKILFVECYSNSKTVILILQYLYEF